MHHSLTAELRNSSNPHARRIKTILVTPGQLSTAMFSRVRLPAYAKFLGPVVEPVELARVIVGMVDYGVGGEVSAPLYARWIEWVFVLPSSLQRVVRWVAGVDGSVVEEGKKEL